jgi:hypothetical protein
MHSNHDAQELIASKIIIKMILKYLETKFI